jgi:hypothetical protein
MKQLGGGAEGSVLLVVSEPEKRQALTGLLLHEN